MNKRSIYFFISSIVLLSFLSCAKKGSITGGEKDIIPPKFLRATPPNYSTNFNKNEIRIYFDEYIKLKDPQKQIIISPPMDPKPIITPLGGASKYVKLVFKDTLLENTTYSISFGESIEDNNEGNPLSYFKYIFSTGNFIDSLSIKGTIADALLKEPDTFVAISLYEVNENYTDSIVYKEVPRYIGNTLDSTHFTLDNLKAGQYKLVALKDASTNYTFEPKRDKIGFLEETINLPADTSKVFNLKLFKEVLDFSPAKPKQASKHKFIFGYEGNADDMKVKLLTETPSDFETRILKDPKKDSLYYWFKPFFEKDSLTFEITNTNNFKEEFITRFRDQKTDSLVVTAKTKGTLPLHKPFKITANIPLDSINNEKISLVDKDTIEVPFTSKLDIVENEITFDFERGEQQLYKLQILPEAIKDFYGNVNDTLQFNLRTKKLNDYGKIFVTLENVSAYPVIVELTNEKSEIISSLISTKDEELLFEYLEPGKYDLRVIFDTNNNGIWDTGSFLLQRQPERVSYYPKLLEVRANWELKQTFKLQD
ncbi:Ig-like domain-containing domain [Aquimarina rhabdastrellae]